MKRAAAAILLTACVLAPVTLAQVPPQPPKPGPEHKWMDYFVGRWTGEAEVKASPIGPAGKSTFTEDIEWFPGGFFLVMHWEAKGPEGEAKGLVVMGYNAKEKVYFSRTFDSQGGTYSFQGPVEGDTWTGTSPEFKRDGKLMKTRYVNKRLSPTSYSFKMEYSMEGGPWSTYMEGKATKTQAAAAGPREKMQFARVGERPVAYHVLGTAPGAPLLLINGGPGFDHSFHHLSPVWEQLAASRRVVFFDQPGTGQSWPVGPQDPISIAEFLDSIEAVRQALNAPRVVLVGHSWGGYLAMRYAVRHPANVEAMILVDSVAAKIASTEHLGFTLFPDIAGQLRGLSAEHPDQVQKYIRLTTAMSFYSPEIRDRIIALLAMGRVEYNSRLEVLEKEAAAHDLTAELKALAMPVLVTTGRFDAAISPRTAWTLHQAIPRSKWVVFERSGHFPMLEEPEAFVTAIEEFLRPPQAHGALKGVPGVKYVDRGCSGLTTDRTEHSPHCE